MTGPKRHHFLPECYLSGFSEEGFVHVYDRNVDQYRKQTPRNTAVECHRYSLDIEGEEKDPCIETDLLAMIDGWFPEVIEKIDKKTALEAEDKEKVAFFVSHLWFRVPDYEKQFTEMCQGLDQHVLRFTYSGSPQSRAHHERFFRKHPELEYIPFEEMQKAAMSGEYKIVRPRGYYLMSMIEMGKDMAHFFKQMDWSILHPEEGSIFITTDCPFTLIPPADYDPKGYHGVGIITPGALKTIPLSKTSCLVMLDHGDEVRHLSVGRNAVRSINLTIARSCDGHLYGSSRDLLSSLVKRTRINRTRKETRVRMH